VPRLPGISMVMEDEWWAYELGKLVPPKPTPLELVMQLHNGADQLLEFATEDPKMHNGYPPLRVVQVCAEIAFYAKLVANEFHDRQVAAIQNAQNNSEQELNR
jgi:hypothetical protein